MKTLSITTFAIIAAYLWQRRRGQTRITDKHKPAARPTITRIMNTPVLNITGTTTGTGSGALPSTPAAPAPLVPASAPVPPVTVVPASTPAAPTVPAQPHPAEAALAQELQTESPPQLTRRQRFNCWLRSPGWVTVGAAAVFMLLMGMWVASGPAPAKVDLSGLATKQEFNLLATKSDLVAANENLSKSWDPKQKEEIAKSLAALQESMKGMDKENPHVKALSQARETLAGQVFALQSQLQTAQTEKTAAEKRASDMKTDVDTFRRFAPVQPLSSEGLDEYIEIPRGKKLAFISE